MNNRNFPRGPFPALTPELLAQIAAAAFRPPPPMSAPPLPSAPHVRGMSPSEGFRLLNEGLDRRAASRPGQPSMLDFLTGQWMPWGGTGA